MRLWSLHPKYLDKIGLIALWRESLLAKKVLECKTKGYVNHPQLLRFRQTDDPIAYINAYLQEVLEEAINRGYKFDANKLDKVVSLPKLTVTDAQIEYEYQHLLKKLKQRSPDKYLQFSKLDSIVAHPLFKIVEGEIETWEKVL
jgi:hypothetical protein